MPRSRPPVKPARRRGSRGGRDKRGPIFDEDALTTATPGNQVLALDAKSGRVLWRYRRQLPQGAIVMHSTSRGVALYGDKLFFAAGDAALVALDARTGREQWITQVADNASGYYMTLAPLVAAGKVMVGASGGELGIRGFVAAFAAGCVLSSIYGFLSGAWPFGIVELVWSSVALRRYAARR